MRVTLLGSGTPAPNPERRQAAVLVEIGPDLLLFDVGRGALHQLARGDAALERIAPLFITHHHFDHIGELFDLIITSALCGRATPLPVYGPPGTVAIVRALLEQVYARDIRSRVVEWENVRDAGLPNGPYPASIAAVDCHDVTSGVVCETAAWRVIAEPVRHGDYDHAADFDWTCLGYRIEADDKVVVISGDTVPCPGIIRLAADADLLVQCCHFPESAITTDAAKYMTANTLPSSGQIGPMAAEARVRQIVLTHISASVRGSEMIDQLRRDVQRGFDGTVTVGADMLVLEV